MLLADSIIQYNERGGTIPERLISGKVFFFSCSPDTEFASSLQTIHAKLLDFETIDGYNKTLVAKEYFIIL
jgi:hypothetical protein